MSQKKAHSHYEVMANQIAGIIVGWCIVYFLFPVMGVVVSVGQTTLASSVFFIASYGRMYLIRRFFNERKSRS